MRSDEKEGYLGLWKPRKVVVVLGKWVADPEPDNPESGFGVPRKWFMLMGFSLFFGSVKRKRKRSLYRCGNARCFNWGWGAGFFGFWV